MDQVLSFLSNTKLKIKKTNLLDVLRFIIDQDLKNNFFDRNTWDKMSFYWCQTVIGTVRYQKWIWTHLKNS